ncbi:unnamed protein product [Closterium sp. Yama58-4]|nr:unnamed protein product [Closterium sp. Yama58-4]
MEFLRSSLRLARQARVARKRFVVPASVADDFAVSAPRLITTATDFAVSATFTNAVTIPADVASQSTRHAATHHGSNPHQDSNRRAASNASREQRTSAFESSRRKVALWGNGDHGRLGLGSEMGGSSGENGGGGGWWGWGRVGRETGGAEADRNEDGGSVNVPRVCAALEDKDVCHVGCGGAHTVVLTADGRVYSMGLNDQGQLGLGESRAPPLVTVSACCFRSVILRIPALPPALLSVQQFQSFVLCECICFRFKLTQRRNSPFTQPITWTQCLTLNHLFHPCPIPSRFMRCLFPAVAKEVVGWPSQLLASIQQP